MSSILFSLFVFHFHPHIMLLHIFICYAFFFLDEFIRYKKLLCAVDITKDFFFSYSYRIMHSLQKNVGDEDKESAPYETMFVWNSFLTRKIRTLLGNSLWTVALIHGFFKQVFQFWYLWVDYVAHDSFIYNCCYYACLLIYVNDLFVLKQINMVYWEESNKIPHDYVYHSYKSQKIVADRVNGVI